MIFKKTLINLAMIQTVLAATGFSVGLSMPTEDRLTACLFWWMILSAMSLAPAIGASFLFACISKGE